MYVVLNWLLYKAFFKVFVQNYHFQKCRKFYVLFLQDENSGLQANFTFLPPCGSPPSIEGFGVTDKFPNLAFF